jgi:predicted transcriptional regulator
MTERFLTITLQPDWKGDLRAMAQAAKADEYEGEVLNFESPEVYFGKLSEMRWGIVSAAQGKGEMSVHELAHVVGCDVKRVNDDIVVLTEMGMLERTVGGGVICPFSYIHIDMYVKAK